MPLLALDAVNVQTSDSRMNERIFRDFESDWLSVGVLLMSSGGGNPVAQGYTGADDLTL